MHAKKYLNKILKNHGWECGTKEEDKIIKPIHPNSIKELETTIDSSSEVESNQLGAEEDIGYAVAELSKFSASPACCHYKAIKQESRDDLPKGTHIRQALSDTDQKFIGPEKADQLAIYVNAAHATDIKQRQSMGNQTALFAGTAIAYSAKWQITVATSSTKAEFVQAVSAAKLAKYLQIVLNNLGIQQCGLTMIFEDNAAVIMMANHSRPNG
eukprot:15223857-Ditylum_brightwellii.AAC.1